jgi:predicted dehydrogenase
MSDALRLGIVGTGGLGTHLGEQALAVPDCSVVAIAEIAPDTRAAAGDSLGVPADARYEDYKAMLDAEALDAVIIATPHTLHYEQILACMDRDLHVLCEKPLTTDRERARDLVARDEAREETLMVGYQRHVEGPYVTAREQLRAMDGDPTILTASVTQNWIEMHHDEWRANPELSGGGQLYDTGSHIVDFLLWTTGLTPSSVSASMVFWDDAEEVDVQATLDVEFEEGAVATVAVSGDAPAVREHHRYWTDDGAVCVDGRGWNDRTVHVVEANGAERYPHVQSAASNKVAAFVESIREGTEPPATARHAFAVTALTEAAYESAHTGERVAVDLDVNGD